MIERINRKDIDIILTLKRKRCNTKMRALSVYNIAELADCSVNKVRQTIKMFYDEGVLAEGIKCGKFCSTKTYYITEAGYKYLIEEILGQEVALNKNNDEEEVEE